MISIAGVIGAGLFIGSATAIAKAGPAVLIAYALAGTLVVLVMRMLGEMAAANPDTGSFSTYADRALGRWAGFSIGWLYWWFWVIVLAVEATAGALILHSWVAGRPAVGAWRLSSRPCSTAPTCSASATTASSSSGSRWSRSSRSCAFIARRRARHLRRAARLATPRAWPT